MARGGGLLFGLEFLGIGRALGKVRRRFLAGVGGEVRAKKIFV
jgi:hypothetical protein